MAEICFDDLEKFLFSVTDGYVFENLDEGVDDMSYQSSSNSSPPMSTNSDSILDMDFSNGNETRGKKRSHEVDFEEQLHKNNIWIEMIASRDHFLKIEKETSIPTKSGTEHIIYFEPFLNYDLVIKEIPFKIGRVDNWFEIHIKPEDWARAFVQGDLSTTVKYLIQAILHHPDLPKTVIMEETAYSNAIEIIKRAAIWMMSKFEPDNRINLWSFGETFAEIMSKFPPPNERDGETISKIIRDNDPRRMFLSELTKSMDHITPAVVTSDQNDTPAGSDAEAANNEKAKFEGIFKRVVDSVKTCVNIAGGQMKTAHVVGPLTKKTIPRNTDRFVDSVQFSEDRWKRAFKEGKVSMSAVARKLISTMIRLDFEGREDEFTSVDSLNPVKLAAVLCAAKFLFVRRDDKLGWKEKFDSRIVQHNVFPTKEEYDAIKEELWLHVKCTVLGRQQEKDGKNSKGSKVSQKGNPEVKTCNCPGIPPKSDQIPTTSSIMYRFLPGNTVPIRPVEVSMLTYELIPFDKGILLPKLSGIEPELLKADCSESIIVVLTVLDRLKEPGKTETRRHAFTQKTWNDAVDSYKTKGPIAAGTEVLLTNLFKEEELKICTPGGRRKNSKIKTDRNKLNDDRQTQLFDALWYLVDNVTTPSCTKQQYRGPWSLALKQLLKIDVFHYGTKKFRGIERRPRSSKVKEAMEHENDDSAL